MKKDKKIYTTCTRCLCDKNPTKHTWCYKCAKESYAEKTHCKCGNLKEKATSATCKVCRSAYYRSSKERRFLKLSKQICSKNSKLVNYVERIERRGGLCSMLEIFELIDIWESAHTNTIKYDNLSSVRQIEKMWNDIKKIYYTSKKTEKTKV